jgi:hypothetical protein
MLALKSKRGPRAASSNSDRFFGLVIPSKGRQTSPRRQSGPLPGVRRDAHVDIRAIPPDLARCSSIRRARRGGSGLKNEPPVYRPGVVRRIKRPEQHIIRAVVIVEFPLSGGHDLQPGTLALRVDNDRPRHAAVQRNPIAKPPAVLGRLKAVERILE